MRLHTFQQRLTSDHALRSSLVMRREASEGGWLCRDSGGNSESAGGGISQSMRLSAGVPHPLTGPPRCPSGIFPRTTMLINQASLPSEAAPNNTATHDKKVN
jgi:hypothetical protein